MTARGRGRPYTKGLSARSEAVRAYLRDGRGQADHAARAGVSERTFRRWVAEARRSDIMAVKVPPGAGNQRL